MQTVLTVFSRLSRDLVEHGTGVRVRRRRFFLNPNYSREPQLESWVVSVQSDADRHHRVLANKSVESGRYRRGLKFFVCYKPNGFNLPGQLAFRGCIQPNIRRAPDSKLTPVSLVHPGFAPEAPNPKRN